VKIDPCLRQIFCELVVGMGRVWFWHPLNRNYSS
jgi:hypothetical protein